MNDHRAWVDLGAENLRDLLIALIGNRYGQEPEKHLDEIRKERHLYMNKFINMAAIGPTETVLELGSGCGFGTRALAEKAARVIACDISPAYMAYASKELAQFDNLTFELVQSRDLSTILDGSVDTVVSTSVFIHLNLYDIYIYFKKFYRILKHRGKVIFDFADSHRLVGLGQHKGQIDQFVQHAGIYDDNPINLAGLMQWNSAKGIVAVARLAGFRKIKRRGHRLLFRRNRVLLRD